MTPNSGERRKRCWRRTIAVVAALLAVGTACSRADYGVDLPDTERSVPASEVDDPTAPPALPGPDEDAPTRGTLVISVADLGSTPRPDVRMTITPTDGRKHLTITTNRRGVARVRLLQGTYELDVPVGCVGRMLVRQGDGGTVGIAGGETTRAELTVDVERRYAPRSPTWTREPAWPAGETVGFTYLVYDRCTNEDVPRASLRGMVYTPSSNLRVVDGPLRADGQARVTMRLRCTAAGAATLILADAVRPREGTDLLNLRVPFDPTVDWCG